MKQMEFFSKDTKGNLSLQIEETITIILMG